MIKKILPSILGIIIANVLLIISGFIITAIYTSSTDLSPAESFLYLWNYEVKISYVIIGISIISLLLIVGQLLFSKNSFELNRKKRRIKQFCDTNYKLENPQEGVLYRFKTYIHSNSGRPFITDLKAFCTKHNGANLIMDWIAGFIYSNSTNHHKAANEYQVEKLIESQIHDNWEKVNNKY